ncbi:MAG: hypothetical protein HYU34_04575 [Candidatus Omnitrophica bacterium]|nr:hypothetical protein [Candidatus Omnitrophota bacterium]
MPAFNPLLATQLRRQRIGHAYLFTGPEGPDKIELALGFARSLNCEREKVFEACDCLSCRKIEKGIHPDVRRFGQDEKSRSIKIEEMRALIHEASLKPYEGRWKVYLVEGAERLTPEAANALLKTLEEPAGRSVFLLLVENKSHLLDTLQSRSFEIRVAPGQSPGAGRTGGRSPLDQPAPGPESEPAVNRLRERLEAGGWKNYLAGLRETARPGLLSELESLLFYLRDCSAAEWEQNPGRSKDFLDALDTVYEVEEALTANVNQKLALTHLEIRLGNLLHG